MVKLTEKQHARIRQSILNYFRENKMDAVAKKFKKEAKVDEENIENAPNLQQLWDEYQKKQSPEDSGNESDSESDADKPPLRIKKSPLAKSTPARKKKNGTVLAFHRESLNGLLQGC